MCLKWVDSSSESNSMTLATCGKSWLSTSSVFSMDCLGTSSVTSTKSCSTLATCGKGKLDSNLGISKL